MSTRAKYLFTRAKARWESMPVGTRVIHKDGLHGTVTKRTGGSYLWVHYDGEGIDRKEWWELLAPESDGKWSNWQETGA